MSTTLLETITDGAGTKRTTFRKVEPRLEAVDRERLRSIQDSLAAELIAEAMDEAGERLALRCGGREIEAVPLDPRRVVRAMARYACFN